MKQEYINKIREACISSNQNIGCSDCNSTGKEICNNPDHEGIEVGLYGADNNRIGCPVCGHDELYRTKYDCCKCNGSGYREIQLTDILLAIKQNHSQNEYEFNVLELLGVSPKGRWNLKKPLEDQEEETLKFISEIV